MAILSYDLHMDTEALDRAAERALAKPRRRGWLRAFGLALGPGWTAGYLSGLWVALVLCGTAMLIGAPLWSLALGIVGGTVLALVMLRMTGGAP